ncbi:MAG: hypothetical protein OEY59_04325 [Deltaproteobacteria bacterium]|nr:hypothetical protein [Deltaproteobacteria bacterium]
MRNTYKLGRIFQKLTAMKIKKDPLSKIDISEKTRQLIKKEKPRVAPLISTETRKENPFEKYQRELSASKLVKNAPVPKSPGKILKLPTHRQLKD